MLPLLAATTVALAGSLLGYDLAKMLLSWGGGLGGAAIGGAVGWFGPALAAVTVTTESQLLLAALLAPGLARAWQDDEDVSGFGSVTWLPERLPEDLHRAVREQGLRVDGW